MPQTWKVSSLRRMCELTCFCKLRQKLMVRIDGAHFPNTQQASQRMLCLYVSPLRQCGREWPHQLRRRIASKHAMEFLSATFSGADHSGREVFARSNAGIVGSNPTQGMNVYVCLFCVRVVIFVGRGFAMGWSLVQRVLPTVWKIKKLKSDEDPAKGCRVIDGLFFRPWFTDWCVP
jgi:hypothetical protein